VIRPELLASKRGDLDVPRFGVFFQIVPL
jgi:hypothetical protein